MNDTSYHFDIYSDLFITHGGLFSKKTIREALQNSDFKKIAPTWRIIKSYVVSAINTSDEVGERQPILAKLFSDLKLGKDIKPLPRDGDLLLRDFIIEVKQPSLMTLAGIESSSQETNDQQLLRAMHTRSRDWGILTNAGEWQFVSLSSAENALNIPFLSFSVSDMIRDETNSEKQISLFVNLLKNRDFRRYLLKDSERNRHLATQSFATVFESIMQLAKKLGSNQTDMNNLIKLIFRLSFIFYAEDIGALPRSERIYRKYDMRRELAKTGSLKVASIISALTVFSKQQWSARATAEECGNSEFMDAEFRNWLKDKDDFLGQLNLSKLWLDENGDELDLSEISSADLCDIYQSCVKEDSDNVGSVYTSKNLSNFINHSITKHIASPLRTDEVVLDPACGSGHLLKRLLFIAQKLVPPEKIGLPKADLIYDFCVNHIAGIDKNETATFITKINLWLSCIQKGKSLPRLTRICTDNTLNRFEKAYEKESLNLSKFLGPLGSSVKIIVSNPPWSMVEGKKHPEKWISESNFWQKHKVNISAGKNNVAYNFCYLSEKILDAEGVAVVIMPGVFFVGSDCTLRDYLIDKIKEYAPCQKNNSFSTVSKTQNFGIVSFTHQTSSSKKIYFGLDNDRLTSVALEAPVHSAPAISKEKVGNLKFKANTLLPLFSAPNEIGLFHRLLQSTSSITGWSKGNKSQPLKGPDIEKLKEITPSGRKPSNIYVLTPENRGSSFDKVLNPKSVRKVDYEKASHKVLKLQLDEITSTQANEIMKFLRSQEMNTVLSSLRTSKSIQAAILNLIGVPIDGPLDYEAIRKEAERYLDMLINKIEGKLRSQPNRRSRKPS